MQLTECTDKYTPELWVLYLEADPEEAVVRRYLPACRVYAIEQDGQVIAQVCIFPRSRESCELKNLAVAAAWRGKKMGARLCEYAFEECRKNGFTRISVATADVPGTPVPFYEKLGFTRTGVIKDFFIHHYKEPIYDNGNLCKDMIVLHKKL